MKFTIVVVMLAMAFALSEASAISWAAHGHPEWSSWGNAHHGAWDDGHHHGSWDDGHHHGGWSSHGTHGISLDQGGWGGHHHSAPVHHVAHAHHDHHHDHHDHHHDHHHAGHYVAKTLGAVHTAPLPGHIASVKSINVASPPGTHY